jgi:uncharacterized protein YecE (DUF72 family)
LAKWARWLKDQRRRGHHSYVYFDNDQKSAAPKDAARLMELLSERTPKRHTRRAASAPALHAAR